MIAYFLSIHEFVKWMALKLRLQCQFATDDGFSLLEQSLNLSILLIVVLGRPSSLVQRLILFVLTWMAQMLASTVLGFEPIDFIFGEGG